MYACLYAYVWRQVDVPYFSENVDSEWGHSISYTIDTIEIEKIPDRVSR